MNDVVLFASITLRFHTQSVGTVKDVQAGITGDAAILSQGRTQHFTTRSWMELIASHFLLGDPPDIPISQGHDKDSVDGPHATFSF